MVDIDPWNQWIAAMAAARDADAAERALTAIAPRVAAILPPGQKLKQEWQAIGLEVEARPLATSGLCVRGTRRIIVRSRDRYTRRRYTVAHELAHLLLTHADGGRGAPMSAGREETACERFASRVLIPRHELCAYVGRHPVEPSIEWLRTTAGHFRASISATVIALGEIDCRAGAFVLARRAGHPMRPRQVALRIAHSAAPDWLVLPRHQRLASLGFDELIAWQEGMTPGSRRTAVETGVMLRGGPAAPPRTAGYRGPLPSEALVPQGAYALVLALDVSELEPFTRVPVPRRRPAAAADQLALAA